MSLTNLDILKKCLKRLKLELEVGEPTQADGSCFLNACIQNMELLACQGLWTEKIPEEEDFRRGVISFMDQNRKYWTTNSSHDDESFNKLLVDQAKSKAWTDMNGTFIEATCKMLGIELHVVRSSIPGPILPSGMAGPYIRINSPAPNEESRPIFYMGLLQDESMYNGHYQFLRPAMSQLRRGNSTKSPSPLKIKKGKLISKYLRSPTPKRVAKETHCKFCPISATRIDLELHLQGSPDCHRYYRRNYKIKGDSILPIIIKEFPCLFCLAVEKNWRITNHFKKSPNCLHQYLAKFNVSTLKDLQKKLELLRKQLRPSVVNRKLEMEKLKTKNDDKEEKKTEIQLLNDFRRQCTFSNVLLCIKCGANYCQQSKRIEAFEVDESLHSQDSELKQKRRFQKFHQCQDCSSSVGSGSCLIKFIRLESENKVLYAPLGQVGSSEHINPIVVESDLMKNITFLLPSNIESLKFFEVKSSKKQNVGIIYKLGVGFSEIYSIIYETEYSKYKNLKIFGDRYEGTISDEGTLTQADKVINDSSIVASDSWKRISYLNLTHRLEQLGAVSFVVTCEVPMHSSDILATIQVQLGKVITVDYVGDGSNEMMTQYYLHTNHGVDTDCSDNCVKVPLMEYLRDINFDFSLIKTKFLSAYLSSAQQKFSNIIKHFVKSQASMLHAENYYFQVFFKLDNSIEIKGLLWPEILNNLNTQIGMNRTLFDSDLKNELIGKIDATLMGTCHKDSIINYLKISNTQAEKLLNLILTSQHHVCAPDHKCDFPKIPLLSTQIIEWSPNYVVCKEFNNIIKRILMNIRGADLSSTTEEWLLKIFSSDYFVGDIIDDKILEIKTEGRTLSIEIDERLMQFFQVFVQKYRGFANSPLIAFYHYSASTGSPSEVGGVIVRRPILKDIYIVEYNVTILKAMGSQVEVTIKNGFDKSVAMQFQCTSHDPHWSTSLEIGDGISGTHEEVSAVEAMSLFDSKFLRSSTSNPVEFICATEKRKKFFKKVLSPTDKSLKMHQSGMSFEPQSTNIERFFLLSKKTSICLAEFVMFYDYTGSEESKNLYKFFKHQGVEIKDSERKCAYSNECFLPEFILLENQDVMKIRTNQKVISFPRCEVNSKEHMYQQVLLFSKDAKQRMTDADITSLFWQKDDPPVFDENGDMMTIIRRVKR